MFSVPEFQIRPIKASQYDKRMQNDKCHAKHRAFNQSNLESQLINLLNVIENKNNIANKLKIVYNLEISIKVLLKIIKIENDEVTNY